MTCKTLREGLCCSAPKGQVQSPRPPGKGGPHPSPVLERPPSLAHSSPAVRGQGSYRKRASNSRSRQRPAVHSGMSLSSAEANQETRGQSFHREKPEQSSLPPELSLSPQNVVRPESLGEARRGWAQSPPRGGAAPRAGAWPPGKKGRDLRAASIWGVSAPRAAHSSGRLSQGASAGVFILHLNQEQS